MSRARPLGGSGGAGRGYGMSVLLERRDVLTVRGGPGAPVDAESPPLLFLGSTVGCGCYGSIMLSVSELRISFTVEVAWYCKLMSSD